MSMHAAFALGSHRHHALCAHCAHPDVTHVEAGCVTRMRAPDDRRDAHGVPPVCGCRAYAASPSHWTRVLPAVGAPQRRRSSAL